MHNVTVAFAVLLVMLLSYFFGCFNGSFMVSHFIIRDDVRKHGSGNAGLTNFYRTYGAKYALLVIACDMGKTVAACLLGSFFFRCLGWDGTLGTLLAGLGCELGHIFPVFYGFRGGKGILSGGTLVLLLNWRVAAVAWGSPPDTSRWPPSPPPAAPPLPCTSSMATTGSTPVYVWRWRLWWSGVIGKISSAFSTERRKNSSGTSTLRRARIRLNKREKINRKEPST